MLLRSDETLTRWLRVSMVGQTLWTTLYRRAVRGLARSKGKRCDSRRGPRNRKTQLLSFPVSGGEKETGILLSPGGSDFDLPFGHWLPAICRSEVDLQPHQERVAT